MAGLYLAWLFVCLAATFSFYLPTAAPVPNQTAKAVPPLSAPRAEAKGQVKILDSYGKLPLSFEANHGQTDGRVKFFSRSSGYTLFLTQDEAVLALRGKTSTKESKAAGRDQALRSGTGESTAGAVLRMRLRNANPAVKVTGTDKLAGTSNYFLGNDPKKWSSNVPTYAKVKYEEIYPGIDLVYYGNQRQLEYDFIVAVGADPHRIAFDVRGAKRIRRDAQGDLVLEVGEGEIRWHKPVVYQEKGGARQEIAAQYALADKNRVGFEVAKYDLGKPLYIDPLIYSTYLGGNLTDYGNGIAVDNAGNAYVTGRTVSTNFPTVNPLQPANASTSDSNAFVSKINAAGSALVYSTYLGGKADDFGCGIAVDSAGDAYVTGYASSTDFPTVNALQPTYGGGSTDAFVAEINPTGSALVYSTYLGGDSADVGNGIAVDNASNAYVTGYTYSTDFPTKTPLQPANGGGGKYPTVFVAKINAAGSALVYSTYLGGSFVDIGSGIAVDGGGNAYVTGNTQSTDFPTKNPLQPANGGGGSNSNAFAAEINAKGSALVYSTYLGGTGPDSGNGIAVDNAGNAYLTGYTTSSNFPVTSGAFETTFACCTDGFVSKISPSGSALVFSTYLGESNGYNLGNGIAVDGAGASYITGLTTAYNFPITPDAFQTEYTGDDAFVSKFSPSGSALVYSTYLGGANGRNEGNGIAVDSSGNIYVTGETQSMQFPTTPGAFQTACGDVASNACDYGDAFVTKFSIPPGTTTTLSSSLNPSTYGESVTFTAIVSSSAGTPTGPVNFLNGTTILYSKLISGGEVSFTTSTLPEGSNSITANFEGDVDFAGSTSAPVNQVVLTPTTTTVSSSLNPSIYGEAVTFTARVTSSLGAPPNGETVTFMKGTSILGTGALNGGSASFTTSTLPPSRYVIKAVYGGDASFTGSTSKPITQVVSRQSTTTTLTSSQNPSSLGQSVTFTASVASQFGGSVTGQVTFYDGTTILKTVSLSGDVAELTTAKLTSGSHTITATYKGSANFSSSSASLAQTVN